MDAFTTATLIGAIERQRDGQMNVISSLVKDLQGAGPSEADVARATALIGKPCTILHTSHVGVVIGPNMACGGFYGGERYPVRVRVNAIPGLNKEEVFEYGFDDVIITGE